MAETLGTCRVLTLFTHLFVSLTLWLSDSGQKKNNDPCFGLFPINFYVELVGFNDETLASFKQILTLISNFTVYPMINVFLLYDGSLMHSIR